MNISVLIPAYNASLTLERAINSVLNQNSPVAEIILVDDGSTDGTAQLAQKYGVAIRYFYHENAGIAVTRNHGIKEARSEWIAFLDADDEWLPHWVSTHENILRACPQVVWSYCNHEEIINGIPVRSQSYTTEEFLGAIRYFETRVRGVAMGTPGFVIRRSVCGEVGMFREEMRSGQDDDMWERIAMRYPYVGYYSGICWRNWHDNVNSVTRTKRARDLHVKSICENALLAQSLGPEVFKAYYPWGRKRAVSYILRAVAGEIPASREIVERAKTMFPLSFWEHALEAAVTILPPPIARKVVSRLVDR